MLHLTDAQKETVLAIADAFAGPLPENTARDVVSDYMETLATFSNDKEIHEDEKSLLNRTQVDLHELGFLLSMEMFLGKLPADKWNELKIVLALLATGWGTKLVTGAARMVPFHELTVTEREAALETLSLSPFAKVRSLFQAFKILTLICVYAKARTIHGKKNPLWPADYAGEPQEQPRPPRGSFWEPAFEEYVKRVETMSGWGETIEIETDVVVVGSGAGGGVVAAELAKAGHRVLVLEKANYYHPADASFQELQSFWDNFENSLLFPTEDLSMMLMAGSAWGGGTHINWSASLRPPQSLCDEWATEFNLPYFTSQAFQDALEAVCTRAGVSDAHINHNVQNQIMLDGAAALGYPIDAVPQNTAGQEHSCGHCGLGCPYGEKQGTHVTWLKDAADAGAKFIDGCHVGRVTYDDAKRVTGVVGTVLNGKVPLVVKAKTVVSACGSLNTPALLLRSGLTNPNIGSNLRVHPVTMLHGYFPNRQVHGWEGSILTTVCNVLRNLHGHGYGARLEVPLSLIGMTSTYYPWRSNADHRRLMMQYPRTVNVLDIVRDLDSVTTLEVDSTGRPRVHFQLGQKDATSLVEGMIAAAKMLLSQGAVEINASLHGLKPLQLRATTDLANPIECHVTQAWFAELRRLGAVQNSLFLGSAHQMGSCRMGATPDAGAVNPDGESWEVQGLYVADASLFPTASGVNPMVTVFGVAYSVAQFIKANLSDRTNASRKTFAITPKSAWYLLLMPRSSTLKIMIALCLVWWRRRIWTALRRKLLGA
ncbi:Aste57867_10992 [Aphanomyces stellatus]|uniref:Long-chain-alcohol oxidase n=1 Tax=Aphanomyces stellatus TaxID=120398 RepID=A0A485KS78_9STRA|nr:hypothetical protein As57867_010951 [Aphanomyces stellatus]VFT87860.1 Aste57867_10992 [Aphanomyces stellatus]